jgi:hypothetical protein
MKILTIKHLFSYLPRLPKYIKYYFKNIIENKSYFITFFQSLLGFTGQIHATHHYIPHIVFKI